MRVLVTGGAGFIGSHLAEKLARTGHKVTVIDNLSAGSDNVELLKQLNIEFHQQDIADFRVMNKLIRDHEIVFHLAAMNRAGRSVADPLGAHESNATGSLNVFEASKRNGVRKVIFISSSSVLGGSEGTLTADTPHNPLHPYGVGKATAETYARIYNSLFDQNITTLRYFSIYGPRQKGNLDYPAVIAKFVMLALDNQPLTIYGDGKQLRNYTHVDDAVNATISAMEKETVKNRVLHVANPNEYSIHDIVTAIRKEVGKSVTIKHEPLVAPEPRRNFPDITETREQLDWEPKVNLEEGIKRYIEWYKGVKGQNEK